MTTEQTQWAQLHKIPAPNGVVPTIYFDPAEKCFYAENSVGNWIANNETQIKRRLRGCGLSAHKPPKVNLSEVEQEILRIETTNDLAFAGPLAGHDRGLIEMNGQRVLVTSAAKLVAPQEGDWPIIHQLLKNMLMLPGCDQLPYFYGWLKTAYEALEAKETRPGQVLVLAGPANSGKSRAQWLITEVLGGRSAKPYRYMCEATPFNSELFGAEHLMIEDEVGSSDMRVRRKFGAKIKDFTVNEVQSLHAKNRDAVNLKPSVRVSISVNDEPENLMVLPPLDESLADKMLLLKVAKVPMPMPTDTTEQRKKFRETVMAELAAFIHFLKQWQIPEALRSGRFGITHFHHPDLVNALDELSPELHLLSLMDAFFFDDTHADSGALKVERPEPIPTTAAELQRRLCNDDRVGYEAKQLLSWRGACGTYLGRLANKFPDRVKRMRKATARLWQLYPPRADDA